MTELKQIISKLPKLTKAEKQTLRQALDFLDGGKGKATTVVVNNNDWLTPGIEYELRRRGMSYPALTERRLNSLAPGYTDDAALVMIDLRQKLTRAKARTSEVRLHHAELLSFGRTVARVLAEYLQPVRPLGLKFMLGNVAKVPDAIEAAFPDYLASGMVWLLVATKA